MPDRSFHRFRAGLDEAETLYSIKEGDLRALLDEALDTIHVDQIWYISNYPDVGEAIQEGDCASAKSHYKSFGYFEGRFPFEISVDSRWYVEKYQDVDWAIKNGVFADAQSHFDRDGYLEGRLPYKDFRLFGTAENTTSLAFQGPAALRRSFLQPLWARRSGRRTPVVARI